MCKSEISPIELEAIVDEVAKTLIGFGFGEFRDGRRHAELKIKMREVLDLLDVEVVV